MLDALTSDFAPIFAIPAIAGSFFFILRLSMMLLGAGMEHEVGADGMHDGGLDSGGGLDHDIGLDPDAGLAHGGGLDHDTGQGAGLPDQHADDSSQAFKILSIQTIAGFVMGFGWGGLGAYRGLDWSPGMSVIAAIGGGVLIVWVLTLLFKSIGLLHASGNIPISAALGCIGSVYTGVPARGEGRGKVRLVVKNHARIYSAVSGGGELPRHTRIKVVMVNRDNTLTVLPENT